MKTYVTIAVERNQIGKLEKDVSEFMDAGYYPYGGLVAVGDRLIQPMILTDWKKELGIDGSTRHAVARPETDLGGEAGTGDEHLDEQPLTEPRLREDGGQREPKHPVDG